MVNIKINGRTFTGGKSVQMINGKVFIDGELQGGDIEDKVIHIVIEGNPELVSVDACDELVVHGNIGHLNSSTGDVEVNGNVEGNIKTSTGDVSVWGTVGGDVETSTGDISFKK